VAITRSSSDSPDTAALLRGDRRARPRGRDRRAIPRRRVELMGLPIDQLTETDTVRTVLGALASGRGGCLFTPNLHHLHAYHSGHAADLYAGARLIVADGMPLIWATRLRGTPLPERVAGSNLIWSLTRGAAEERASIFLLGGDHGAAERTAERMVAELPDLRIAGLLSPAVGFERDPAELARIKDRLFETAPEIVFVALGFPKQEQLALELSREFPRMWFVGVGISFSFVAGEVKRAPRWMQRAGLEWLHRLVQEPRRLFRRYVIDGIPFAFMMFAYALRQRRALRRALGGEG
jgi:N-acetylglucosaminyldiphosphoundecaprenol N-acetyl-beta-D-mannosaminyltransferase